MKDKQSGIYCIENIINHKKYIGQSIDVDYRIRTHKTKLKYGNHHNSHLQNAYNKYGQENFKFYTLELCDINMLDERECYYISLYNADNHQYGYNSESGGHKGRIVSDETRKKHSGLMSGKNNPFYGKHLSDEHKKNLSQAMLGEKNHFYGKHHSKEAKKNISKLNTGRKHTDEAKKKMSTKQTGDGNSFYGKHHTEDAKKKIGKQNLGEKNGRSKYVYCPELNVVFGSAHEASRETGVNRRSISYCATGAQKTAGKHPVTGEKLHWVYIDKEKKNDIC